MESMGAFLAICGAIAVGAVSPGPSFIFVARHSLANGKGAGLRAALGVALAGGLYALLAVFGLAVVLSSSPPVFTALKWLGAGYLSYIGFLMIRYANVPLSVTEGSAERNSGLLSGFLVQLGNAKTAVVYMSVFAALLPKDSEPWLLTALPLSIAMIEAIWYLIVALLFANARTSARYAQAKPAVDRVAGVLMLVLAARLVWP